MNVIIERLSQEQLLIAILALIGGIVLIAGIIATSRHSMQTLAHAAAYDREKLDREMEIRNKIIDKAIANGASLESLLALEKNIPKPISNSENLDAELATGLGKLDISPDEIEETLSQALSVEPDRKKAMIEVISELIDEGSNHASILAAVRGLCASVKPTPKEVGIPESSPAV